MSPSLENQSQASHEPDMNQELGQTTELIKLTQPALSTQIAQVWRHHNGRLTISSASAVRIYRNNGRCLVQPQHVVRAQRTL